MIEMEVWFFLGIHRAAGMLWKRAETGKRRVVPQTNKKNNPFTWVGEEKQESRAAKMDEHTKDKRQVHPNAKIECINQIEINFQLNQ